MNNLDRILKQKNFFGGKNLKNLIAEIPVVELIDSWDELSEDEAVKIFSLLSLDSKVDLINALSPAKQEALVSALSRDHVKVLLEELEPDDLADFIQAVSSEVRESVWNSLSEEAKQETQFLLRFDEDDAAGLMTPRYLAIASSLTVSQALAWVRKSAKEVETVYYVYVVDRLKRLHGVISLKEILAAADDELIDKIAVKNVVSVRQDTDQETAARILETYDLVALPVVDRYNRLLGIITFDDIIDVIRDEQTEDLYKMGAMGGGTERYLDSSVWRLAKKRIPWLAILLIAATFTTNVLAYFESLFVAATVLTLFIPTIIGTGGNTGSQSSTLIIRGLATGDLRFNDLGRVLVKEILVGLLIGASMALLVILRSLYLPPFIELESAFAVGISLGSVVIVATMLGAFAPLLLHRLGLDPAVMTGPLITTLIDIGGLTIYFVAARLLLRLP
jgi:magnesium transporter